MSAPSNILETNVQNKIFTKHGPALDDLLNEFSHLFTGKCKVMKDGLYKFELEPQFLQEPEGL